MGGELPKEPEGTPFLTLGKKNILQESVKSVSSERESVLLLNP